MKRVMLASLIAVLLLLHTSVGQADPKESTKDWDKRGEHERAREGRDRDHDQELRKDWDEMDRELAKAATERDRELAKVQDEAARENKPEKFREKRAKILAKYAEQRRHIIAQFEEKHGSGR